MILSHLGVDVIVIREMTKYPENAPKIAGNAIILKLVLAAISSFLCLTSTYALTQMGYLKSGITLPVAIYLSSFFLLFSFGTIYNCIFQANMKLGLPAIFSVFSRILLLASIFVLVYFFDASLIFIIMAFLLFVIPNVMMGLPEILLLKRFSAQFVKPSFNFDKVLCMNILKSAIPLALSSFFIIIYTRIDQLMIKYWFSFSDLAPYSVAVRLSDVVLIIPHAFMTAVFPILSRFFQNSEDQFKSTYNQSFKYMISVGIFIAGIFSLYPERLLSLFYSEKYTSASTVLVILSWSLVFVFAGIVNNRILVSAGLQLYDLLFTGVSALVNIILNIILIPKFGIEGAAIATFIAYSTGPILGLFLRKTKQYSKAIFLFGLRPLTASIVAMFISNPFKNDIIISLPAYFVLFFTILYFTKGITNKDLTIFREVLSAKPENKKIR